MLDPEHSKILTLQLAHRSLTQVLAETFTLVVITLAALVGNSCVLYVFYKSPRLRIVTNYYVITLAISDVAMALIIMPLTVGTAACGRDIVGVVVGQVIGFIGYTLVFGSLQTTTLIAINRFFCMVKPLIYRKYFKPKTAMIMIIAVWMFSFCNTLVVYTSGIAKFKFFPGQFVYLLAYTSKVNEFIFNTSSCLLFVAIPLSITSSCYWKICGIVKEHNATVSSSLHMRPSRSRRLVSREEVNITKSILPLVCGFVVCWIPCALVLLLSLFYNLPRHAQMIFIYTAYTSSVVNPIVFNLFNKPFKNQSVRIFGFKKNRIGISSVEGAK